MIAATPFADVSAGKDSNDENAAFVERATVEKVMAATADNGWKLIIALSRYAGLRIPSEMVSLRWEHVLWDQRRVIIHAKKTRKIEGKAVRIIPLFDELEPLLRRQLEEAEDGAVYVLPDRLRLHANPGTMLQKLMTRAGVKPWPRQFHNMRASLQTELLDIVGPKATCDWLGNDERTAHKHYLRTTDGHFARVLKPADAENAARIAAVRRGNASHAIATADGPRVEKAGFSDTCNVVRTDAISDAPAHWPPWDLNPHSLARSGF